MQTEIQNLNGLNGKNGNPLTVTSRFKELLNEVLVNKSHLLAISSRRGLAPSLICRDCGSIVECPNCKKIPSLHLRAGQTLLFCHHCLKNLPADLKCSLCGSWNLKTLGIGIEQVAREIESLAPKLNLKVVSSDTVSKPSKHLETPPAPSVLLITEPLLAHVSRKFPIVVIVHIDNLFALPEFQARERIFRRIIEAKNLATENFLIQTRRIGDPIFKQALAEENERFRKTELEDRKRFGYPPTVHLVKLTGKKIDLALLRPWRPVIVSPNRVIIKTPLEPWPDNELGKIISSLRGKVRVELDPESIN